VPRHKQRSPPPGETALQAPAGWRPSPARSPVGHHAPIQHGDAAPLPRREGRAEPRDRGYPVKGHCYTCTGRATSGCVGCSPGVLGASALPWPTAAGLAERQVQRSVHAHVSLQYQRRSGQAPPPSATIWSAGNRMPHIQQDLVLACSAQYRTERRWPVVACPPEKGSGPAAVRPRGAGMFTGAAGASNGRCSRSASGSSSRSSISDVLASYGQPAFICKSSPSLSGTRPTHACARRRSCLPLPGPGLHPCPIFQVSRSRACITVR